MSFLRRECQRFRSTIIEVINAFVGYREMLSITGPVPGVDCVSSVTQTIRRLLFFLRRLWVTGGRGRAVKAVTLHQVIRLQLHELECN